jgi:predicted SnoaL-like aldol condensation-catalyzing enzyme
MAIPARVAVSTRSDEEAFTSALTPAFTRTHLNWESTPMSETAQKNKQRVREIIEKIVNGGDVELAAEYYREDYIQHNPLVAPGLVGLQALLRAMHASGNPMQAEIELINAEDDMVWVLMRWTGGDTIPGSPRLQQTIEIFRVEDGKMAEHWDMLQFGADPS